MIEIPAWHPLIVHFPLALVLTSAAAFVAAHAWRDERMAATLATLGTWNLCLGAVGAVFAFGSGLAATLRLQLTDAARAALSLHVRWAVAACFLVLLVAVWRGAGAPAASRPSRLFLGALLCACLALIATGYRGGLNVYAFGIGVASSAY
jgi:uncharacterized membrane protein